jgi:hypothetical protein
MNQPTIWYYWAGETSHGPYSQDELQALRKNRIIDPETPVAMEGIMQWKPYSETFVSPGPID